MDTIQSLVSRYLDDELSDTEVGQLCELLRTDADALERFVLTSFLHAQLAEWMDQQRVQDDAVAGMVGMGEAARPWREHASSRNLVGLDELFCGCAELGSGADRAGGARRFGMGWVAAWAATLLAALGVTWAAYFYATRPAIVAQLTEATNCQWAAGESKTPVGALLASGEVLELHGGRALVTCVSGAQILLEGPVTLRLDSPSEVSLEGGAIAVKVPTQAIGFTVATTLGRFVDLGTAFTLKLEAGKQFDLYVFEGLVELRLDARFGEALSQPLRVSEVRAVRFDVTAGDIVPLPFDQGEQMPF